MHYKIMWDNGNDCGMWDETYATEEDAEGFGLDWVFEMCAIDGLDHRAEDCPYSFDIIEVEDEPSEDDIEEAAAAEEQTLDYFNRYIAGDR